MLHLHSVILFLFNNHNFVKNVWGGTHLENHLSVKLGGFIERHGDLVGLVNFLAELDAENLKLIEQYIKTKHPSHYYKDEEVEDEQTKAVSRASNLISNDYLEIPSILEKLSELEDQTVLLDHSLDEIIVWKKVENSFTVSQFLDEIGW